MTNIKYMNKEKSLFVVNMSLLIIGSISVITAVFISAFYTTGVPAKYAIASLFALGSISGIISVYFSNKKSLLFFLFGILATLFKLSYPIVQIVTGATSINYSVIIGQFVFLFIGLYQFINWKRMNDDSVEGKFATKVFENKNSALNTVLLIAIFFLIVSLAGGNTIGFALLDTIGGASFFLGVVFMAMGNVWAFAGFIISNITWIGWTVYDIVNGDALLVMIAAATLPQVIAYLGLAITGWIEWS